MISVYVNPILKIIEVNFENILTEHVEELKIKLRRFLSHKTVKKCWQFEYINKIIETRNEIIMAKPSDLERLKTIFDQICDSKTIEEKANKGFRNALLERMGYSKKRSDFYPSYFQKIGIKSCVYCNSQFALVVERDSFKEGQRHPTTLAKAKFQIDHFLPQSRYPCFSISLFNLYPVCATCNNIKGQLDVNFQLYNEDDNRTNKSKYKFSLEEGCVANYLTSNFKTEVLKIVFKDPDKPDPLLLGVNSISDTFDIRGIYNTQIDIVEELIQKRRIYNTSYKEKLVESFPDLFNHSALSERVLLGNYHLPEDIHKRPMAKFMQDIDNYLKGVIK